MLTSIYKFLPTFEIIQRWHIINIPYHVTYKTQSPHPLAPIDQAHAESLASSRSCPALALETARGWICVRLCPCLPTACPRCRLSTSTRGSSAEWTLCRSLGPGTSPSASSGSTSGSAEEWSSTAAGSSQPPTVCKFTHCVVTAAHCM